MVQGIALADDPIRAVPIETGASLNELLFETSGSHSTQWDRALFSPNMFGDFPRTPRFSMNAPGVPSMPDGSISDFLYISPLPMSELTFFGNDGDSTISPDFNDPSFLNMAWHGSIVWSVFQFTDLVGTVDGAAVDGTTIPIAEKPGFTGGVNGSPLHTPPNHFAVFNQTGSYAIKTGGGGLNPVEFNVFLTYDLFTDAIPDVFVFAPNPIDGGLVGRQKVSTDNNPLPRDRFIFNYDYLNNAPLSPSGINIQRVALGMEKTFFSGNSSLEVRVPFATTLDSHIEDNGTEAIGSEFGNVQIVPKVLLVRGDVWNLSSGLGISLPTADDVHAYANGDEVLRIENNAVVLKPFAALLWTPTDRTFGQLWVQGSFDTQGNPVSLLANTNLGGTIFTQAGSLNDPAQLAIDTQLGYWLIHPNESTGWLQGFAPFVELHYNTNLQDADSVSFDNVTVVDQAGHVDTLNITGGATAQIADNWNVSVGASAPLRSGDDKAFDYTVGARVNYFFGPTGRDRRAGYRAINY